MHLFCVESRFQQHRSTQNVQPDSPFLPDAQEKHHPKIRLSAHLSIVFVPKSGIVGVLV